MIVLYTLHITRNFENTDVKQSKHHKLTVNYQKYPET